MVRIGIIGAGPNAAGHANYYHSSDRAKVIAVADPIRERAEALASQVDARSTEDFRTFLDSVDAVVVSSPNFLHEEHAIAVAQAGKHVYCEKPLGLDLASANRIAAAIDAAGVRSCVGFAVRFDAPIQTMIRRSAQGDLGPLLSLCSRRVMYVDPASFGWRTDPEKSGGLLYEINIHELDWMIKVGGPVESVYARTWAASSEHPRANDHLWITLNFAGGPVGIHEGGWLATAPQFYRSVQGTEAGLVTNEWGNELYFAPKGAGREPAEIDPAFDLRGHFLATILDGETPVSHVTWARQVMAVSEAVMESARTGEVVRLHA